MVLKYTILETCNTETLKHVIKVITWNDRTHDKIESSETSDHTSNLSQTPQKLQIWCMHLTFCVRVTLKSICDSCEAEKYEKMPIHWFICCGSCANVQMCRFSQHLNVKGKPTVPFNWWAAIWRKGVDIWHICMGYNHQISGYLHILMSFILIYWYQNWYTWHICMGYNHPIFFLIFSLYVFC